MMVPLFACSFITLVFVFERAISLRRGRVIPRPFVKRFLHQVREGKLDRDQALELCQENGSPIAEVFAAAVRKWGRPSVELEQTVIDAGERASSRLAPLHPLVQRRVHDQPADGTAGHGVRHDSIVQRHFDRRRDGPHRAVGRRHQRGHAHHRRRIADRHSGAVLLLVLLGRVERLLSDIDGLAQELVGLISAEAMHDERQSKLRSKSRPPAAA